MKHTDALCPLCYRPVHSARTGDFTFIDCCHCSHYHIDDEGTRSLLADPLPPDEVAHIASYNWEWPTSTLTATNVRVMGRWWRQPEHHRFCRILLPVLYNTYRRRRFTLRFSDPMLLGCTASASPAELRALVTAHEKAHCLPMLHDRGHSMDTVMTDYTMLLLRIPVVIAPGIAHAINLNALRKQAA